MGTSCGGACKAKVYEAHWQIQLSLMMKKIELDHNMTKLMPLCRMKDLGGYMPLTKNEVSGNVPLLNQLKWQLAFFKLHTKSILEYVAAPQDRRIDPTYCLVRCQYTLAQFDLISKYCHEPHNFLLLPIADRFCIEKYFLSIYGSTWYSLQALS